MSSREHSQDLYSVRMRAAAGGPHEQGGTHISGGERLVPLERVEEVALSLIRRAFDHEKGSADFLNLMIDKVPAAQVGGLEALPVSKREGASIEEGRAAAVELLVQAGVPPEIARLGVETIARGPAPGGGAMRGAILMDADTGRRLEPDPARGLRVTSLDWHPGALAAWREQAQPHGIANERIQEALALASKVARTPGTVAELCWSDDPGYVAGYVASEIHGYVRVPVLKEPGSPLGGRVYFVRGVHDAAAYEAALQAPVLLDRLPPTAIR